MTDDYIIHDSTHVHWPGALPYRDAWSRRGYRTAEDARSRMGRVVDHYNATRGTSPGQLSVRRRVGGYRDDPRGQEWAVATMEVVR
jgi:hypothetical protein